jgi:DNA-binding IclR family transcriptional regulator
MTGLTDRQAAVIAVLAERYPAPVSNAVLVERLGVPEGRLNVTLRSLNRLGLILPVPRRPNQGGGWRLTQYP